MFPHRYGRMKDMEIYELYEEYNRDGVCTKRTINGFELPHDTEPSVQILTNVDCISQKRYLTKEEVKQRYGKVFD